jgi:carbonic anhydrase
MKGEKIMLSQENFGHGPRAALLRRFLLAVVATTVVLFSSLPTAAASPADSRSKLEAGNARFTAGAPTHPNQDAARRAEIAKGQAPYATILTCSDSRVAPEVFLDQGLGDVFVVRVAGNVADTDEIGSIEYGVGHLNTPLLVVLGHTGCGAVKAVLENAEVHGSIPQLVDNIVPAVERARAAAPGAQLFAEAVKTNVWQSIDDIFRRSPEVRGLVKEGKLQVVGAVYDLTSGSVQWMGEHAEQARLLAYTEGETTHSGGEHGAAEKPATSSAAKEATTPSANAAATSEGAHSNSTATGVSMIWLIVGGSTLVICAWGLWLFATKTMSRWTIKSRLSIAFSVVFLLVIGSASLNFVQLKRVRSEVHGIREKELPMLENIDNVRAHISEVQLAVLRMMLSKNASERDALDQSIKDASRFLMSSKSSKVVPRPRQTSVLWQRSKAPGSPTWTRAPGCCSSCGLVR